MGLTFAKYVIQPFFPDCPIPMEATAIVATLTICKYPFVLFATVRLNIFFSRFFDLFKRYGYKEHDENAERVHVL